MILQPRMDPIKRMFADLAEANGAVRVRFHPEAPEGEWNSTEKTMTYREYMSWLATTPSSRLVLEWVQQVRGPHQ